MNKITNISKINIGKECSIQGFVENIRNKSNVAFLVIKDITGKLQIVINKVENPLFNQILETLTPQSVVTINGVVVSNPSVKLNGIEMKPNEIIIESLAASPLPLDETSLVDQRLDYR
jgi:aspartyl-tRNA synthetase